MTWYTPRHFGRWLATQHLAQDVAQVVFSVLARKAEKVSRHSVLVGWLYVTARKAAAQAIRNERRWRARSLGVETMDESQDNETTSISWERVRLLLDTAMCELRDSDREAILVRFFKGRAFEEAGRELGVSADSARMRVNRTVDRLRVRLARHGVASRRSSFGRGFVRTFGCCGSGRAGSSSCGRGHLRRGRSRERSEWPHL